MNFELTEEQQMIRDAAREFAQNEIAPVAAEFDRTGEFPAATIAQAGELGFMGIEVPQELGGAGLDIDDGGAACDLAQFLLHFIQFGTMVDRGSQWPADLRRVFFRFITHNDKAFGAFSGHLLGNGPGREVALIGLSSGHRDGIVVEQLEGDISDLKRQRANLKAQIRRLSK